MLDTEVHESKATGGREYACNRSGHPVFGYKSQVSTGKSVIRSRVEHVFADQKSQMGLFIRTVGITRTTMRGGLGSGLIL